MVKEKNITIRGFEMSLLYYTPLALHKPVLVRDTNMTAKKQSDRQARKIARRKLMKGLTADPRGVRYKMAKSGKK